MRDGELAAATAEAADRAPGLLLALIAALESG